MRSSSKQRTGGILRRVTAIAVGAVMTVSVLSAGMMGLGVSVSAALYHGLTFDEIYRELLEKEKEREEAANGKDPAKPEDTESTDVKDPAEPEDTDKPKDPADTDKLADTDKENGSDPANPDGGKDPTEDKDSDGDDEKDEKDEEPDDPFASVDPASDEKLIRVGLMYGTNVTVGFEVTTTYGFTVNRVKRQDDLSNKPLWDLDITKLSVTVDANLKKTDMTYSKTSTPASVVIGGYHVEITKGVTKEVAESLIVQLKPTLESMGAYAIPAYIYNGYRIRTGHFASAAEAQAMADKLSAKFPDLAVNVCSPTNTAVSVVDPMTDIILFEYDEGDVTALGLTPKDSPEGERAYLVTPAKKLYDGTFMFRRYISDSTDGVSLTDIIPLGEYIKGVLPYEISNAWPKEAQKAFAICVRSFTLAGLNRHEKAYQVDVCNSTHCQVYSGRARINDLVEQAVEETAGLVMSYGGEIVTAFYSAVAGGVTVGVDDAWGGTAKPYLVAVETPWEIFTNHSYGVWTAEVSGAELGTYLRETKGYTKLKGDIVDITVDQRAKNSDYIYQITFTDSYGNKVTVKTTDGVRTALSKYVNSSNFVVGKGSVKDLVYDFSASTATEYSIATETDSVTSSADSEITVLTADGLVTVPFKEGAVITESGTVNPGQTSVSVEETTVYAKNSNNFIFSGRGWGHGVGLSQIGVRDLAKLGYEAIEILGKYFTDIEIRDWRQVLGVE